MGFEWDFIEFDMNTYLLLRDHVLQVEMAMLLFKTYFIVNIRRIIRSF